MKMKPGKKSAPTLKALRGDVIKGEKVRLREKKLSDVRNDYKWQADPELARLDAAPELNMSFSLYLLDYATMYRRSQPDRYPLAIDNLEGKHIGNCTCYDIDGKKSEAQVGIMIGNRDYWDRGYGEDALNTLVDYIFRTTMLNRLYLKTLDWNMRAQKCFGKCGFQRCGYLQRNNFRFILMELKREDWEKRSERDRKGKAVQ
jgi:RimJ/RimL family protein N-acetyltransferase